MKIAIIGGGAAGMMAAATISEKHPDTEVFLIERNPELGKKVMLTGGGRCNLTTGIPDISLVLGRYPRGGKFLNSAMRDFSPEDVRNFFEEHGVGLKIEEDMRVFPASDKSRDVVDVFGRIFSKNNNVHVVLSRPVQEVSKQDSGFLLTCGGLKIEADKLIITTGGKEGGGHDFAKYFGHHVSPLAPSLNALVIKEEWTHELAGVSIERARLSVGKNSFVGPFVFTHKGVSGPAVFAISSMTAFDNPTQLTIDFAPDMTFPEFEAAFKKEVVDNPKKLFRNTASMFMPKSVADVLCEREYLEKKHNGEISKGQMTKMIELIKHFPLTISGRVPGDEFVTAGGIYLDEINPRTMESKLCSGLYFAGEVLNIDGVTGGFNLQAAWATGRLAGESACE